MAVYLVTWNLNRETAASYTAASQALHVKLDALNNRKISGLETVRFVATSSSADMVFNHLADGILDENDKMVVCQISGQYWGHLTEILDWIQVNR